MKAFAGLIVLCFAGLPAFAQPPVDDAPTAPPTAVQPIEEAAGLVGAPLPAGPGSIVIDLPAAAPQEQAEGLLGLDELSALRGGETIVFQNTGQNLNATNTGNSVIGNTIGSGAVNLSPNAFRGFDGIGNFVINTGHNNNLQGSISVSIAVAPQ